MIVHGCKLWLILVDSYLLLITCMWLSFRNVKLDETFQDEAKAKEIEKATMKCSQMIFNKKTLPSLCLAQEVGNMYTPSLYSCLASLLFRYCMQWARSHCFEWFMSILPNNRIIVIVIFWNTLFNMELHIAKSYFTGSPQFIMAYI